jgi:hypothetical protein
MTTQAKPSAQIHGVAVAGETGIVVPPLTPLQTGIAAVGLVLLLWLAYRIGKVILSLVAGLLFLGLMVFGIWYLFIR